VIRNRPAKRKAAVFDTAKKVKELRRPIDFGTFTVEEVSLRLIAESNRARPVPKIAPDIHQLARSIKAHGPTHLLFVCPMEKRFELIAGHSRFAALHMIGARTASCQVFTGLSDVAVAQLAWASKERAPMTPLENAELCERLERRGATPFEMMALLGWTNPRLLTHHLRLSKEAPPVIRESLHSGQLAADVAIAMIDASFAHLDEKAARESLRVITTRRLSALEAAAFIDRARYSGFRGVDAARAAARLVS
jgi:ParB-like chromosome segregation protein Spo0J